MMQRASQRTTRQVGLRLRLNLDRFFLTDYLSIYLYFSSYYPFHVLCFLCNSYAFYFPIDYAVLHLNLHIPFECSCYV